jgi:hypothetical protein
MKGWRSITKERRPIKNRSGQKLKSAKKKKMEATITTIRYELEDYQNSDGRCPGVCRPTDTGPQRETSHEDGRNAVGFTNVPRCINLKPP